MNEVSFSPVIVVYVRNWKRKMPWGGPLKNPRIETMAGRHFLVGERVKPRKSYPSDQRMIFAWDEVLCWREYPDEASYSAESRQRPGFFRRLLPH